ncbi:MAG TPA: DoxX family protein [Puia sp.]|jgi:uncharacterized membrane protein YphA (DoxX/SURF4 family)|nr:DoxX family protein [Puia sp.]
MLRQIAQLYLRLAAGIGFFVLGLDRLGAWGPYGKPWVSWGDWKHFSIRAHELMSFLPYNVAETFAMIATFVEVTGGFLLVIGLFTKQAALACSALTLCFSIAMAITDGITSPMNYSVFTVSAACLLLASLGEYRYSLDGLIAKKRLP